MFLIEIKSYEMSAHSQSDCLPLSPLPSRQLLCIAYSLDRATIIRSTCLQSYSINCKKPKVLLLVVILRKKQRRLFEARAGANWALTTPTAVLSDVMHTQLIGPFFIEINKKALLQTE